MSLEEWVIDELSKFLGLDDETLKTAVVPYLWTLKTPDALSEHLMSMLGTSSDALSFIETFTVRRFEDIKQQQQKQFELAEQQSTPQQQPTEPQPFPSLPVSESSSSASWPANINVYMKKGNEGNYYTGGKSQKSKAGKGPRKDDSVNTSPSNSSSTATTSEQRTEKKKKKKKNEMTLETALKELDIQASERKGKRRPCQCQATKHPLLTVAPNCLNCGKIICTLEGVGPCTFCGTPVLSKEQMVALVAEAKRKRAEQKQLQNQQMQQRKAKAAATPAVAYAAKVSGDIIPRMAYQEPTFDDAKEEENRRRAEQQKEKLLEFQRTSAKRTTVIDQASDFMLPTDQFNPWLTPQERALQMKKQQANLQKLQNRDSSSRRRVMTIDIQSKQVSVAEASSSESDSEPEEYPEAQHLQHKPEKAEDGSAGTYASNPLLKGIAPPKFIGKHTEGKGQRRRRKQRVQYDEEELYDDYLYASSIADNRDITVEPITCKVEYQENS